MGRTLFHVLSYITFGVGIFLLVAVANTLAFQKRVSSKRARAQLMALILVLAFVALSVAFLSQGT